MGAGGLRKFAASPNPIGPVAVTTPGTSKGNGFPLPSPSACAAAVIRVNAARAESRIFMASLLFRAAYRAVGLLAPAGQPGAAMETTAAAPALFGNRVDNRMLRALPPKPPNMRVTAAASVPKRLRGGSLPAPLRAGWAMRAGFGGGTRDEDGTP